MGRIKRGTGKNKGIRGGLEVVQIKISNFTFEVL